MTEYQDRYENTDEAEGRGRPRGRLIAAMAVAGLVGVLAVGSAFIFSSHAGAGAGPHHGAWCAAGGEGGCSHGRWGGHGRFRHGHPDPEEVRAWIGFMSDRMLGYVDATDEQRTAVEGILDRSFAQTFELVSEREDAHEQLTALLAAPEVDRAALEALRARHIEFADAVSRQLTTSVAEIAEVLTPAQRADLAELHERFRR